MNFKIKTILYVFLVFAVLLNCFEFMLLFQDNNQGDFFIHMTFAKNIAQGSFSYNGVLSNGTTAPLYTLFLGLLYFFMGETTILVAKLLSFMFYMISAYLLYIIAIETTKSKIIGLTAVLFWLLFPYNIFWCTTGMETFLFIAVSLYAVYALISNKNIVYTGLLLGTSYLIRPEALVLIILSWYYILFETRQKHSTKERILFILTTILVPLSLIITNFVYFGYVLTSSQMSRILTTETIMQLFGLSIGLENIKLFVTYFFPATILFCISIRKIIQNKNKDLKLIMFLTIIFLVVYTFVIPSSRGYRYLLPIIPFFFLISVIPLRNKLFFITMLFIVFTTYNIHMMPSFIDDTNSFSVKTITMQNTGLWMKENLPENITTLAYEVQIGYYSEKRILSLNGILDYKALSYIENKSNLYDFITTERPDYLLGYFPCAYGNNSYWSNTIFASFPRVPEETKFVHVGDTLNIKEISFEVVHIDEIEKMPIYKMDYQLFTK